MQEFKFLYIDGEMARRFREVKWEKNPLGAIHTWDQSLKTAIGLMLRSAFPQFLCWGPEKIFLYNDAYIPVLGAKHPASFGSRFQEIWSEIWTDLEPAVLKVESGHSSYYENLPLIMNRNGNPELTFFTFSYSPLLDDSENIQGLFCSCIETTASKTLENNLRKSKIELQIINDAIENSLNGFDIVNEKGEFIYANRAYLNMWGYSDISEILGTSPAGHCLDPEVPGQIIKLLRETGECNIEFVALRKDGTTFDVNMWARIARDANGNEIYPTTSIDITEKKRAETELRLAKDYAEEANRLKSAFLANMSHEIRTPLGAMLGFADLLKDASLSVEERGNYLEILIRNGNQLSIVINDILDLSKVEAGHLTLEYEECRVDKIAIDVVSLLKVKADAKKLDLQIFSEPGTEVPVTTDPVRLHQILLNLIGNAIKFTHTGSVTVRCYVLESEKKERMIVFEVRDTGVGIAADKLEQVFEMFVQADDTMTKKFGGTGLGLALSRKLARCLGGDVIVKESELEKGSVFQFTLKDSPHLLASSRNFAERKKSHISKSLPMLDGVRVLAVDDSPDNRLLIGRYLVKQHAIVEFAQNGKEGFEKAITGQFDIVLMDLQMPVMDGYTATQKLRENGYQKPIIALTAHAMSDVRKKCLNIGCTDHLTKPLDAFDLIHKIYDSVRSKD